MNKQDAIKCLKSIQKWVPDWDDREDGLSYWDAIDIAIDVLGPPNEPLTLDDLREMDGQPVYIISKAHTISEWNIPKGVGEIVIAYDVPCAGMKSVIPSVEFIDGKNLSVEKYGSDWVAYRRPPEGETDE